MKTNMRTMLALAGLLVPLGPYNAPISFTGDLILFAYLFGLARYFTTSAALDTGSAFEGMGASREVFFSALAEPVLLLGLLALCRGSSSLTLLSITAGHSPHNLVPALLTGASLFVVMLAENARIPVDDPTTHLELTMIHEAMILEYSGRSLALIELSSHVKQMIWFTLIAQIIFPIPAPAGLNLMQSLFWLLRYVARISIIAVIVALVEVSVAKMRLFRVADFLGFAFVLAVISTVCAILGV